MQRISKRLEALERAADKEIFAEAFPFAIAYYLGGAREGVAAGYPRLRNYRVFTQKSQPSGAADKATSGPPKAQARRAVVRRIFVAPDLSLVAPLSAPIGGVVST
jgi:hypothetical protein